MKSDAERVIPVEEVNIFIDYVSGFFDNVKNMVVAGHTNSANVLIYAKV